MPSLAIVNSAAGGGSCRARAPHALGQLRGRGIELEAIFTERPEHATDLAAGAADRGFDAVIAVGGDGTTLEVVNGLMRIPKERRPALGVLPLGTGNSFIRDFGVTNDAEAIDHIASGKRRATDVVRVEHAKGSLYSINLVSVGFSARVGDLTNRKFKSLGPGGYTFAVLASLASLDHPEWPFRIDGGAVHDGPSVLLSFSNSKFTGGTMMMAPNASPTDGMLDVIRVGRLGRLGLLRAFPRIYKGTHLELDAVTEDRGREIELTRPREAPAMIDGEIYSLTISRLVVEPGAVQVTA